MTAREQPAIVLVRPQLGMNIGMSARAMANFGLADLRLVNPRDGWPNPDAGPAAAGADHVLEAARVFGSVGEALHDCRTTYATSMLEKGIAKPVLTPRAAIGAMRADGGKAGILFGPEAAGLSRDDLAAVGAIVTVPTAPDFGSLNLAQTVLLCAWEWWMAADATPPARDARDPPADHGEVQGLIDQLNGSLDEAGWFNVESRAPTNRRAVAAMVARAGWTAQEVRTWRGMIRQLAEHRKRRPRP